MPDTIVPIVRRPVRRTSTDPVVKPDHVSELRKLSIGGETNKVEEPARFLPRKEEDVSSKYVPRKTISSLNKEREKTLSSSSLKSSVSSTSSSRKSSLLDDNLGSLPPPVVPQYEVPSNTTGFPQAPKDNLPKLHEARHKAHKTPVSYFLYLFT